MREDGGELVVARLRVEDDLAGQTYVVNLEDWVRTIDHPCSPGRQRSDIIALLNNEILVRYPCAAGAGREELNVTIEEFSDIKMQVVEKLPLQGKPATGPVA